MSCEKYYQTLLEVCYDMRVWFADDGRYNNEECDVCGIRGIVHSNVQFQIANILQTSHSYHNDCEDIQLVSYISYM